MALTLSRIDRIYRTYDVTATVAGGDPASLTGIDVALLPPRSAPTAGTVWIPATYASGVATVLLAGPDADSTSAVVVPASADLWIRAADNPEVDAERVERITVMGGGANLISTAAPFVSSVNGHTGSVVLGATDVGADPVGAATAAQSAATLYAATGLAGKVDTGTYTTGLGGKQDKATLGADVAADATARAAFDARYGPLAARTYGLTGGRQLHAKLDSYPNQTTISAFTEIDVPFPRPLFANGVLLTTANAMVIPPGGAGVWDIGLSWRFNAGGAGIRKAIIRRNGATAGMVSAYAAAASGTNTDIRPNGVLPLRLDDGDVITFRADTPATGVIVNGQYFEEVVVWAERRGIVPVKPIRSGYTRQDPAGPTSRAGLTRDIENFWMNPTTWAQIANADFLWDPTSSYRAWITEDANNIHKALDLGCGIIPHGAAPSTWAQALTDAVSGAHDADYAGLGQKIAQYGPDTVYLRPFWEFNFLLGTNGLSGQAGAFVTAWNYAIPKIRAAFNAAARPGQTLLIEWCYLARSFDPVPYWPGTANVDVVAADVYGEIFGTTTPTLPALLADTRAELAKLSIYGAQYGKPVAVPEYGNLSVKTQGVADKQGRGDCPEYIDVMFDWAEQAQAAHLVYYDIAYGGVDQTLSDLPLTLARLKQRHAAVSIGG